ncbi:MAG TPA: glycosyltransferase family 39 protein [Ohtaekwangia sp.]|nr:glycosyltransferase family 39 protein [Ohtaekwangia sp.]
MNTTIPLTTRLTRGDLSVPFYFGVVRLLLHVIVNATGGYGLFRDELYYIACTGHLDTGYVDQPPLSIYILKAWIFVFGDSLFSVRMVPAICAALTVWLTGMIVIRMGGGRIAQFMACTLTFSLGNIVMSSFYSMNAIEILSWTIAAFLILEIVQTGQKKHWIWLGLVLGLGLLNKIGVLFLGVGLFAGLILTPQRKWLLTPWPYVAGAMAFVLFLPYVIWNATHDYAHLEFIHNASSHKYKGLSIVSFLTGQLLLNNPVGVVIWLPGLIALLLMNRLKEFRILVFLFIGPFLILIFNKTSKAEYLLPAYAVVWAAGAIWFESLVLKYKAAKVGGVVAMLLWFAITVAYLPMVLPILPVQKYIAYSELLGEKPSSSEGKELAQLPQFYADMFGWKEKAQAIVDAYNTLSEEEKKTALIFSTNYGRCASIEYYGNDAGLPGVIGNHNSYWTWGYPYAPDPLIILGGTLEDHAKTYRDVQQVGTSTCEYCMPYENNVPVFVCRGLSRDFAVAWSEAKHYD